MAGFHKRKRRTLLRKESIPTHTRGYKSMECITSCFTSYEVATPAKAPSSAPNLANLPTSARLALTQPDEPRHLRYCNPGVASTLASNTIRTWLALPCTCNALYAAGGWRLAEAPCDSAPPLCLLRPMLGPVRPIAVPEQPRHSDFQPTHLHRWVCYTRHR